MDPKDRWFAPDYKPPPQGKPRPGELLWEFRKDHHTYSAELRFDGEYGCEAQILKDGELLSAYRLNTRALAVQWADETRKLIEEGWE
jgi:hypothetical protein